MLQWDVGGTLHRMQPLRLLPYPERPSERNRWITERRGPKNTLDPYTAYGAFVEEELGPDGTLWPVATILLTNRECPFRCLMCDLWQNTLDETVPVGAIPAQIERALASLPSARAIKLYNAGSFFDPAAIPRDDWPRIGALVRGFERVIIECHPAFITEEALEFARLVAPATLEVAIGLETVHPEILEKLNKRMTVTQFQHAAALLQKNKIELRVFLLVRPPFMNEKDGVEWACRSLEVAMVAGATFVALIPTRGGNGALEAVESFTPPKIASLVECAEYGRSLLQGRVTVDLWDIHRFCHDPGDEERVQLLLAWNRGEKISS